MTSPRAPEFNADLRAGYSIASPNLAWIYEYWHDLGIDIDFGEDGVNGQSYRVWFNEMRSNYENFVNAKCWGQKGLFGGQYDEYDSFFEWLRDWTDEALNDCLNPNGPGYVFNKDGYKLSVEQADGDDPSD